LVKPVVEATRWANVDPLDKARHKGNQVVKTASKKGLSGGLGLNRGNRQYRLPSPLTWFELQRTEVYLKRKPLIRVCGYENQFIFICYYF